MHIELDPAEREDTSEGIIEEFEAELELNGFVQAGYADIYYEGGAQVFNSGLVLL